MTLFMLEPELGFSIMNYIKDRKRNRLTPIHLDEQMRININGVKNIDLFDAIKYAEKWEAESHLLVDNPPYIKPRSNDDESDTDIEEVSIDRRSQVSSLESSQESSQKDQYEDVSIQEYSDEELQMSIYGISGTRHISQSLSESEETEIEPEPFIYDEVSVKCTEPQPMSQNILDNPVINQPMS